MYVLDGPAFRDLHLDLLGDKPSDGAHYYVRAAAQAGEAPAPLRVGDGGDGSAKVMAAPPLLKIASLKVMTTVVVSRATSEPWSGLTSVTYGTCRTR